MSLNTIAETDFEGTLTKALVHKVSIDQVLLTNYRAVNDNDTLLLAQLPRANSFYCEHLTEQDRHDLVAIIEICRQACFVVAHTQFGAELEGNSYQFLFQDLDASFSDTSGQAFNELSGKPVSLKVHSTIEQEKRKKGGATYGLDWLYVISTPDDIEVARVKIRQTWLKRVEWRKIREVMKRERGITPDMEIPEAVETALSPLEVGRFNPHNVVLQDVKKLKSGSYEAVARINTKHPVLFDKSTEHIYGMIQIEIARQLSIFAVAKELDVDPASLEIHSCETKFVTIGELQIPAVAKAEVQIESNEQSGAEVSLTISQQDRNISEFTLKVRERAKL